MSRVDLQDVGSSEASVQLYQTIRGHVQEESDRHLLSMSWLHSEVVRVKISLSCLLSSFITWFSFYFFCPRFRCVFTPKMGAVRRFETFVPTNRAKHGVVTQKTRCETSVQPKSHVSFLLSNRNTVLMLDCWMSTCLMRTAPYVERSVYSRWSVVHRPKPDDLTVNTLCL
jgi:hypothetical protein